MYIQKSDRGSRESRYCFAVSEEFGGREGIRTPDPLLAKQVLSQLSYTPTAGTLLILKHLQQVENSEKSSIPLLCASPFPRLGFVPFVNAQGAYDDMGEFR